MGSRSSGKSKTGHQIFRNIVMIGDKLVSKYEKKSCTSADKAKTQKASVGGALTLEGLSSLGWSVVEIGKVSAGFLVGGAIIMIGGIWFAMPMDAGESDENVEKAEKAWKKKQEEAGKGASGAKTEAEKERDELLEGAEDTTANKGNKTKNYDKEGGDQQAQEDYNNLDLKDVKDINTSYGQGKVGTDSDGNKVIYRPGSKTGGSTIEIQFPNNHAIKIRY